MHGWKNTRRRSPRTREVEGKIQQISGFLFVLGNLGLVQTNVAHFVVPPRTDVKPEDPRLPRVSREVINKFYLFVIIRHIFTIGTTLFKYSFFDHQNSPSILTRSKYLVPGGATH